MHSILRPIYQSSSNQRLCFLSSSTLATDVKFEVQSILENTSPTEEQLERLVPMFSSKTVTSILQEQKNLKLAFPFFIRVMRRRQFCSWDSHNWMIDAVCETEEMKKSGILIVPQTFNVLITAYAKMGAAEKAVDSFGSCPNTFTYNTMLHLLVQKQVYVLALAVYNQMMKSDCRPNRATYGILIDGLCKAGTIEDSIKLFDEMTHRGISPDIMIYTVIVSGLCQEQRTGDAKRLLLDTTKMNKCSPDTIPCHALLNGFCKLGRMDEIVSILKCIKNEGFVVGLNGYSCLIDGLFRIGRFREACRLWHNLMSDGSIAPDCILYTIMMKGLTMEGKVEDAVKLLSEMVSRGIVPDTFCYNTLIKGFCDMGLLDEARSLTLEISQNDCFPDSATYTILICGLCKKGLVDEAQQIFEEMEKLGCLPTVMTFNALISGLCKAGELEQAHFLFYKMEIGRNLIEHRYRVLELREMTAITTRK
ncbi:hypothetical protein Scep_010492 [Stephania cephalantha]|uniref:Pentatricopeptide repeat-containing protein n=1 Tax=Stephania cephalantha TaxID=152367 RepID=A0AAP0JV52_9MAGN